MKGFELSRQSFSIPKEKDEKNKNRNEKIDLLIECNNFQIGEKDKIES